METIYLDYAPKGVQFYYVYKALAHPEYDRYVTPFTQQERFRHVAEARRRLQSQVPWLCDTISDDLRHAVGTAPNGELVLGPDGRILVARVWSEPEDLRRDLERLVGAVDPPTRVEDLDMEPIPPPEPVATGVLARPRMPERMRPLLIEPDLSEVERIPFYAKLRAEAERAVLEGESGQLYLGFHLDPLYEVHWNNEVAPLSFEIRAAGDTQISPAAGAAPRVEASADSDPREFVLDVRSPDPSTPLELTVRYFACDNANTFCIPVTQRYTVHLKSDPDGGAAPRRSPAQAPQRPDPGPMVERMLQRDRDGDGRLSRNEVPPMMGRRFEPMDANGDGFLDRAELTSAGPGGAGPMVDRMMRRDRDGDGRLSREEVPPAMGQRFEQLDANQDGFLDREELESRARQMRLNSPRGQNRPPGP